MRNETLSADQPDAARRLTAHFPPDQALGLRLIALARAAQAIHMGEATSRFALSTSQAAGLAGAFAPTEEPR